MAPDQVRRLPMDYVLSLTKKVFPTANRSRRIMTILSLCDGMNEHMPDVKALHAALDKAAASAVGTN